MSLYEPVLRESGQPSTKYRAGPLNHVSNKTYFITRREPLKRATPRIKLHIPLIKLIKKDQVCYSAAPSTTNQNATQWIYIKDIKWLGKSLKAYSIKIQYENVFKVIGGVHVILAFLKLFLLLKLL